MYKLFGIKMLLVIFIVFPLASEVHAQTVGIHLASQHFPQRQFNNTNPGMYLKLDNGLTAGWYRNSERGHSQYIGWTGTLWQITNSVSLEVTAGAITGYRRADVLPLLVPSLRIGELNAVRITLAPPIGKGASTALHLSIERKMY